jgi:hypothetical protein
VTLAHIIGIPVEESVLQLAPIVAASVIAVRLIRKRARAWGRLLDPRDGSRSQGSSINEGE